MECEEFGRALVDLLDQTAPAQQRTRLEEHMARCSRCRADLELLSRGHDALEASLDCLAPSRQYLSRQRLGRLLEALEARSRRPRIITLQRFIGAAAAAVILVSCFFIYQDVRSMLGKEAQGRVAPGDLARSVPGAPVAVRVMVTSPPHDRRLDVVLVHMRDRPRAAASLWGK